MLCRRARIIRLRGLSPPEAKLAPRRIFLGASGATRMAALGGSKRRAARVLVAAWKICFGSVRPCRPTMDVLSTYFDNRAGAEKKRVGFWLCIFSVNRNLLSVAKPWAG